MGFQTFVPGLHSRAVPAYFAQREIECDHMPTDARSFHLSGSSPVLSGVDCSRRMDTARPDDGRIGERCGIGRFYKHRLWESLSGEPCQVLCGVTSEK